MFTQPHPFAFLSSIKADYDYNQLLLIQQLGLYLDFQQNLHNNRDPDFIDKFKKSHFCHSLSLLMGVALCIQEQPIRLDLNGLPIKRFDAVRFWDALTRIKEWSPQNPLLRSYPENGSLPTNIDEISTEDLDFETIIGVLFGTQYRNEYLTNITSTEKVALMLSDNRGRTLECTESVILPTQAVDTDINEIKHILLHLLTPNKFILLTDVNKWHDVLIANYHDHIVFWNVNEPGLLVRPENEFDNILNHLIKDLDFCNNVFTVSAYSLSSNSTLRHNVSNAPLALSEETALRCTKEAIRVGCSRSMRFYADKIQTRANQYTVALLSIEHNHPLLLKDLLQKGISTSYLVDSAKTLLEVAAESPHVEIFKTVLQHELNQIRHDDEIDHQSNINKAFLKAALSSQVENCRILIDKGADIFALVQDGVPILHAVVAKGFVAVTQLLLMRGAHLNPNFSPMILYDIALLNENENMVELLITFKLLPPSPVLIAINTGSFKITKVLLEKGFPLNFDKWYLIEVAVTRGHLDIAGYLLNHNRSNETSEGQNQLSRNATNAIDDSLKKAVLEGNLTLAGFLLENGANPTADDARQPLKLAIMQNNFEMVRLLLPYVRDLTAIKDANHILTSSNICHDIKSLIASRINACLNYNAVILAPAPISFFANLHSDSPASKTANNCSIQLT